MYKKVLLLDFGGVIAEEGFRGGLHKIADMFNLDREYFFRRAADLIYDTGYILGRCNQHTYIEQIRKDTGIKISDSEFENIILSGFRLRRNILNIVTEIRQKGIICAILSDQTDWLDRLNDREHFFDYFDYVFNSFHIKMGKRETTVFLYVCERLNVRPSEILFIDDQIPNVEKAKLIGISAFCAGEEEEIISLIEQHFQKRD